MEKFTTRDENFIRRTFELALKGEGKVAPNPMVGAVLVKNGKIISEGYHKYFGGPHAEVYALKRAGKNARGATLYINIEPCCHYGKTPPCTDLIISAKVKRVVAGTKDINPLVNGRGFRLLRNAGIEVSSGILEKSAIRLNAGFFKFHKTGLPYVIAKWAMTLDGKIATSSGDSKWISSIPARRYAKRLRRKVQAIIVGINTVIKDDPRLADVPFRVILDHSAKTPLSSSLVRTARTNRTIIAVSATARKKKVEILERKGCEVLRFNNLTIENVLREIAKRGIIKVMIEGGSEVLGNAFDERVVDEVLVFVSPKIVGGIRALTPVGGKGIDKIIRAINLEEVSFKRIASDIVITGYTKYCSI